MERYLKPTRAPFRRCAEPRQARNARAPKLVDRGRLDLQFLAPVGHFQHRTSATGLDAFVYGEEMGPPPRVVVDRSGTQPVLEGAADLFMSRHVKIDGLVLAYHLGQQVCWVRIGVPALKSRSSPTTCSWPNPLQSKQRPLVAITGQSEGCGSATCKRHFSSSGLLKASFGRGSWA